MPTTHDAVDDPRNAAVEVYVDGRFVHRDEASVSVFDSAFLVGDGIWEGLRLHHGVFAFIDRHLDRLFAGLATVSIEPPFDRDGCRALLHGVVEHNGMDDGAHVRLMISRGRKKTPSQHPANLVAGPTVVVIAEHKLARPDVAAGGISLATVTVRRPPPDTLDQRLNCHSKIHEVVALIEATRSGADEALMLDTDGHVATCNATNFLCVRDGVLTTADATHHLPGITRAVVLDEARAAGIAVHEGPYGPDELGDADEAFVTGTFGGLTPVREIDGRSLPGGTPGPLTRRLRALYDDAVARDVGPRV